MKYFDAHCHVQFDAYDADRSAVLASMEEAGIGGLLVGTDRTTSKAAVDLADGKTLFATIGLHPNDKPQEGYDDEVFRALAKAPPNRGKRNDPLAIPAIVAAIAKTRGEDEEVVREALLENARRVFSLP